MRVVTIFTYGTVRYNRGEGVYIGAIGPVPYTDLEGKMLNIYDYDVFSSKHAGLYPSFQQLVDPGKVVYVMGTISDEKDSVMEGAPTILESLLGVNVMQISCGGQHVAALTDTGSVYTWGRGTIDIK